MAGENNPAAPPAGDSGTPPAGNPPADPPKDPGPEPKVFDAEYVQKLRQEAADYRTKHNAAQGELQKLKDAQLSETDRAKKEATDALAKAQQLEADLKSARVQAGIAVQANGLKIVDADAAYRLLDQGAIQFDDQGKPTNLKELLAQLIKDKPYLIDKPGATTNANNPGRDTKEITRAAYNQMGVTDQGAFIRGGGKVAD